MPVSAPLRPERPEATKKVVITGEKWSMRLEVPGLNEGCG